MRHNCNVYHDQVVVLLFVKSWTSLRCREKKITSTCWHTVCIKPFQRMVTFRKNERIERRGKENKETWIARDEEPQTEKKQNCLMSLYMKAKEKEIGKSDVQRRECIKRDLEVGLVYPIVWRSGDSEMQLHKTNSQSVNQNVSIKRKYGGVWTYWW